MCFDIPNLYISASCNPLQLIIVPPKLMSTVFHHYKELTERTKQVEEMRKVKLEGLQKIESQQQEDSKTLNQKNEKERKYEAGRQDCCRILYQFLSIYNVLKIS